ncbi:MAG TPA: carbon-nitrogen hydrolase family protein [Terrimesophilobacter sp.]|nr:carbon-nitrogen hydrolase family protein [Terrimesophilobacter sp.]
MSQRDTTGDAAALGVAVVQFAPVDDAAANVADVGRWARLAVSRGAALVVFPEYSAFFVPELGQRVVDAAEPVDGPFVAALSSLAQELGVHLVAGMLERADDGRAYNTAVAVSPDGGLAARYRKQHLYDAFGQKESDWIAPGDLGEPQTFTIGDLTVGLQTCYDLRFPEVSRRLVDAGADILAVPSEWVRGPLKEHHWRTLVTARAIENTVFVAAADHPAPIGAGNSMIVDPMGVELVTLGENTDVAVAHVSRARLEQVRALNPALALRRYEVHPR